MKSVDLQVASAAATLKEKNRAALRPIISAVIFYGRQGLALSARKANVVMVTTILDPFPYLSQKQMIKIFERYCDFVFVRDTIPFVSILKGQRGMPRIFHQLFRMK